MREHKREIVATALLKVFDLIETGDRCVELIDFVEGLLERDEN